MSMRSFFAPQSVAVVGASDKPLKGGCVILKNLRTQGFTGAVYPINPRLSSVLGYPAYPALRAAPLAPETVVIIVPRELVPEALREAVAVGARAAIVATAGFGDAGDEPGRALEAEIERIARESRIRLMGPNSIGTIDTRSGFITAITSHQRLPPGDVAVFGQSGMFASGFANWLRSEGRLELSKVACLGNKLDVGEADVLGFLADDPDTRVVGVYFEGLRDGRAFLEAARRAAAVKPVVVLKSGRTDIGRRAAAGHTGALAGDDAVAAGALRQAGLWRAVDFEDFFDLLEALAHCPRARGRRVGVVSITGVGCVLAADAVGELELELAVLQPGTLASMRAVVPDWAPIRNPVDMWSAIERTGVEQAYGVLLEAVLRDPGVDSALAIFTAIPECAFDAAALLGALRSAHPAKPLLACILGGEQEMMASWSAGLRRVGVPVLPSPRRALRALAVLAGRGGTART